MAKHNDDAIADAGVEELDAVHEIEVTEENLTKKGDVRCENSMDDPAASITDTESEDEGVETRVKEKTSILVNEEIRTSCLFKCRRGCKKNSFESLILMKYHVRTYHAKGINNSFECHLCKTRLAKIECLRLHMNTFHTRQEVFKCTFLKCPKIFYRKCNLNKHIKCVHSRKNSAGAGIVGNGCSIKKQCNAKFAIKCTHNNCTNLFESKVALMYHLETFHARKIQDNTFECYLCKKLTASKQILLRHLHVVHDGLKAFQCPIKRCSKKFGRTDTLKWHIENVHSKSTYCCEICTKSFKSISALQGHDKRVHDKQSKLKCPMPSCPRKFAGKDVLKEHILNDHRVSLGMQRMFCCYLCKNSYSNQRSVQMHMNRAHIKGKHLKCPIPKCSKKFYQKNHLRYHMAYKHDQGPETVHRCDICKKIFTAKQSLQRHMSLHGAELRFKCPKLLCTAAYHFKNQLDKHMENKHGEKPMIFCPVCHKSMENRPSLKSHMRLMHSGCQPSCRLCKNTFANQQNLRRHMKNVHSL